MGKIANYQKAVKQFLQDYAAIPPASPTIRYEIIADDVNRRYCLIRYGIKNQEWTHHCVFHFNITDGKILVLQNWTDLHIDEELEVLGVEKQDVVASVEEIELTHA
ncbi:MAG: XisI protein [Lewinellaceae bacterium]|nr:XisI protein [Lewinellaceae bacterium]